MNDHRTTFASILLTLASSACTHGEPFMPWHQATGEMTTITSAAPLVAGEPEAAEPPTGVPEATEPPACVPDLSPHGAWLAADGGRSVPLPNGTSIHLFGDTLVGPTDASDLRPVTFVGNSIGVGACDGPDFTIEYEWFDDGTERGAFFDLGDPHVRLWPMDGFLVDGRLHVVLAKVTETTDGLGFGYAGTVLATVDNPLDPPAAWDIGYHPLSDSAELRPTKGVTVHEGHAYLFSELDVGTYPQPAVLARVSLEHLDAPAAHLEYLAVDETWKRAATFSASDALIVLPESSPSMYVEYHPDLDKWITIQADETFGSPKVVMRTADHLSGPWSEGEVVFDFPEMLEPRDDGAAVICYAVTEHRQHRLDDGNTLIVTYACNTLGTVVPLLENLDLYYPKTVAVDLGLNGPA